VTNIGTHQRREATMRTPDELDRKIAALMERRAKLRETYQDFLTGNAQTMPLESVAHYLRDLSDEDLAIERSLRLLEWVQGGNELFIWR
jgi:hypothetical protein